MPIALIENKGVDLRFRFWKVPRQQNRSPEIAVSQAQIVIRKFGGVGAMSAATGFSVNSIYKWTYAKEKGGTGGVIPGDKLPVVLGVARDRGIDITVDDLRGVSQDAAE